MNLPRQYSYNLRWWFIGLSVGSGLALLTIVAFECGCWPHGFGLWFGLIPIVGGLFHTVRRLAFNCQLVLDNDTVAFPTGLGRIRTKRVPYSSIERVWEICLPLKTVVLCIGTSEGKFEVVSMMLPDTASYIEVGKFLYAQVERSKS
jgi:hypothetical protein